MDVTEEFQREYTFYLAPKTTVLHNLLRALALDSYGRRVRRSPEFVASSCSTLSPEFSNSTLSIWLYIVHNRKSCTLATGDNEYAKRTHTRVSNLLWSYS